MDWNGVRREGIENDHVEGSVGLLRKRQPSITKNNVWPDRTVLEECEERRILCNGHNRRVDLEEGPVLAPMSVTSDRTRPQSDDRHMPGDRAAADSFEELSERAVMLVVAQGL